MFLVTLLTRVIDMIDIDPVFFLCLSLLFCPFVANKRTYILNTLHLKMFYNHDTALECGGILQL